jgi:uncharacterized protein YhaN
LSRFLGLVVVVFSAVVSASAFSSLKSADNQIVLVAVGIISLIATLLASVQAFLNYPELAAKHQTAGLAYGQLRRRLEETVVSIKDSDELKKEMDEIRKEIDKMEAKSPILTQRFQDEGLKIVKPDLA